MQAGGICMAACVHVCMSACLHGCMAACLHVCMATCLHVCLALALKEGREEARKPGRQGKEASLYIHVHPWIGAMKAGCKYGRLVWKSQEREIYSAKTGVFSAIPVSYTHLTLPTKA